MRQIKLTQGKYAFVDDADFEWLNQWKWYYAPQGYAVRSVWSDGKRSTVRMHREVANTPKELSTDHISGNKLDNRRENLRNCLEAKNRFNSKLYKNSTTGFKGVRRHRLKWDARIAVNKKRIHLGIFNSPEEAAQAYDVAAIKYFGKFARLNNVDA